MSVIVALRVGLGAISTTSIREFCPISFFLIGRTRFTGFFSRAFLSGVTPHHADTLSLTYACQPASTSQPSSWRPLRNTSLGGTSASGGFKEDAVEPGEAGDTPRVDVYDVAGGGEVDERRLLDEAASGTIGAQRLAPPSRAGAVTSKLAKGGCGA